MYLYYKGFFGTICSTAYVASTEIYTGLPKISKYDIESIFGFIAIR